MTNRVLLHSGFVAVNPARLLQEEEIIRTGAERILPQSIFRKETVGYYDPGVEALFLEGSRNSNFADFDYRERVLKKAFEVFSVDGSITPFILAQKDSPCYTYLHEKFLRETLAYACQHTERTMSFSTYRRLLFTGTDATQHIISDNQKTAILRDLKDMVECLSSVAITDTLTNWTGSVAGIWDLIQTMHIIFGRRQTPGL
jgi:hypothetical protein